MYPKSMPIRPRRILVVTSVYPRTYEDNYGAFLQEAIQRCQDENTQFKVFAPTFEGCQSGEIQGIPVYRFRYCLRQFENLTYTGAPTKVQNPFYQLIAAFYILFGSLQLFWVCLRYKPDLLHVHWPFPHGLMAYPASVLRGIPMVFTFHGAELLLAKKFSYVADILRWLTRRTAGVTVNSSFTRKLVENIYTGPIEVVPYGQTIEPKPSVQRAPEAIPTLLFVGRLVERKGLTYLLDALPLVLAQRPTRLRIVGKGPLEEELHHHCLQLGLHDHVDFLGFLSKEELASEYAACDIFVLPSIVDSRGDTEGLGVVLIEAMAHAKPIIATEVGGISDVILQNRTGMLVPQRDSRALAEAICTLLNNSHEATCMGMRGRDDVMERFGWKRIRPLWQQVFDRALREPACGASTTLSSR
jgi:glycosyltransferase involved in cell wall biosynthesis